MQFRRALLLASALVFFALPMSGTAQAPRGRAASPLQGAVRALAEGAWRGLPPLAVLTAGATLFVLAKTLKWWAILTLGPLWTFRVIVVPGAPLVVTGPYRWLQHPNYVGVIGEIVGVALMTGALVTGPIATAGFMILLSKRIAVESRMLHSSAHGT